MIFDQQRAPMLGMFCWLIGLWGWCRCQFPAPILFNYEEFVHEALSAGILKAVAVGEDPMSGHLEWENSR